MMHESAVVQVSDEGSWWLFHKMDRVVGKRDHIYQAVLHTVCLRVFFVKFRV